MKGKDTFTVQEIELLKNLICQRVNADRSTQKRIRDKMRKIGFFGRDDYNIQDCQVSDLENLIKSGEIKILGNTTTRSKISTEIPKSLSNKVMQRKEPINPNHKIGLEPWVGVNPKVLILGTLPSDKSLKNQAYYCSPTNSFWRIMRELFDDNLEPDNKLFITSCGIALWDCIKSGERKGSLDSNFNKETLIPNDIREFLLQYPSIKTIVFNGQKAERFFEKYCRNANCETITLVSTSSAASKPFDYKLSQWSILKSLIE